MSAKTDYSTNAARAKVEAETMKNAEATRKWLDSRAEHDKHIQYMESVNINDYVKPEYLSSDLTISARKIIFPSIYPGIDVVADFGGGYMRLQIRGTRIFTDLSGNPVHEKSVSAKERKTHFRIIKMEEM